MNLPNLIIITVIITSSTFLRCNKCQNNQALPLLANILNGTKSAAVIISRWVRDTSNVNQRRKVYKPKITTTAAQNPSGNDDHWHTRRSQKKQDKYVVPLPEILDDTYVQNFEDLPKIQLAALTLNNNSDSNESQNLPSNEDEEETNKIHSNDKSQKSWNNNGQGNSISNNKNIKNNNVRGSVITNNKKTTTKTTQSYYYSSTAPNRQTKTTTPSNKRLERAMLSQPAKIPIPHNKDLRSHLIGPSRSEPTRRCDIGALRQDPSAQPSSNQILLQLIALYDRAKTREQDNRPISIRFGNIGHVRFEHHLTSVDDSTFDLVVLFDDLSRRPLTFKQLPLKLQNSVGNWIKRQSIPVSEGDQLDWRAVMNNVTCEDRFVKLGGWDYFFKNTAKYFVSHYPGDDGAYEAESPHYESNLEQIPGQNSKGVSEGEEDESNENEDNGSDYESEYQDESEVVSEATTEAKENYDYKIIRNIKPSGPMDYNQGRNPKKAMYTSTGTPNNNPSNKGSKAASAALKFKL